MNSNMYPQQQNAYNGQQQFVEQQKPGAMDPPKPMMNSNNMMNNNSVQQNNMNNVLLLSGATPSDVVKARCYVNRMSYNEEILAVWKVSADAIRKKGRQVFWQTIFSPRPIMACCTKENARKALRSMLYILGKKNLYFYIDDAATETKGLLEFMCPICLPQLTGTDAMFTDLRTISGLQVHNWDLANKCSHEYETTSLRVGLPMGSPLADFYARGPGGGCGLLAMNIFSGDRIMRQCTFEMLVDNPHEAAKVIRQAKENAEVEYMMKFTGAQKPVADDSVTQIQKLRGLMDNGTITPSEFEAKKQQLLARV